MSSDLSSTPPSFTPPSSNPCPKPAEVKEVEFFLGWHGYQVAKLGFNGVNWSFNYNNGWVLPLSGGHGEHPGQCPAFVLNLMPESENGRINNRVSMEQVLSHSDRFLSNIVISKCQEKITQTPIDHLQGRLVDHSEHTVFTGQNQNLPALGVSFLAKMDQMVVNSNVPRTSGCQAKLPCNLSRDGTLAPAINTPFTHILKFPGLQNDPSQVRGAVEWLSMSLAKAGGVNTCEFALVEMENEVLAYVAERFDIPVDNKDKTLLYCEDFCATNGNTPEGKYWPSLESMIDTLKGVSTDFKQDGLDLFKYIYANKLLENGDFHFKNAAIIRQASPTLDSFVSTRLAPAYDIMNTRYFNPRVRAPHLPERMSLEFERDQDNYSLKHMESIGCLLGVPKSDVREVLFSVADGIANKAREIAMQMPELFGKAVHDAAQRHVVHACMRALTFCHQDFPEIEPSLSAKSKTVHRP